MELDWARLPEQLPAWFPPAALVLFGLVVGSFLNVVIHRLPRGDFPGQRRSACPRCDRQIRWYENLPVLSWLVLRGRCSGCGAPISPRYLVVELLAAALAAGCWFSFGWSTALPIGLAFSWAVLALVFIDLEHMLLPDAITLPGTLLGLAASFVNPLTTPEESLLGVLLAIFLVEGLNLAYRIYKGIDGLGQGDTKMLMFVGAVLGWQLAVFTLIAGSIVGVLVSIPLVAWASRKAGAGDEAVDEDTGGADEPAPEAAERPSALSELMPEEPEDLLAYLTYALLALSFLLAPFLTPGRALGGFLVGLAAFLLLRLVLADGSAARRFAAALPLIGTLAGGPPSLQGGVAAGIAALVWAVAGPLLARALPGRSEEPPDEEQELPDLSAGLQAALPFGVFLGIGALVSLYAGEQAIEWYVSLFPAPLPAGP